MDKRKVIYTDDAPLGLGTELYESDSADLGDDEKTDPYAETVAKYKENVAFVQRAVGRDIPVIFLYVPFSYVVRPTDLSRWTIKNLEAPLLLRQAGRRIEALLERETVPFVDPTDELISRDQEERMYYFLDLHFTPAGNRVLAEQSIPVIQKLIALDTGGSSVLQ